MTHIRHHIQDGRLYLFVYEVLSVYDYEEFCLVESNTV
jgi:hypothetical protein